MKYKKKLTFLMLHLGYGGIETSVVNLCNSLYKYYDITIVSFYNINNQNINENVKIKYLCNDYVSKKDFLKKIFKGIKILINKKVLIKKEILNSDSDVIVSTRSEFSVLLSKYGKKSIMKIAQEHHHHNNDKKYINVLKKKYDNIDYLFALTNGLKKDYEKFLEEKDKIKVVPNLIKLSNKKSSLSLKKAVFVGRLHKSKNVGELIEIFLKSNSDWELTIVGDGDEYSSLLKYESSNIKLVGYKNKEEVEKILLNSSLFLMTSKTEGLPMVLLEAMNYGIPCIAYEIDSGVCDIIMNNKNGYVVKNFDEFLSKLLFLQDSYAERIKMQKHCKETVLKYSADNVINIWKSILK